FIKNELVEIPTSNFIIEPMFKDTAAAIAYGITIIHVDSHDDEVIVVLASDHLITDLNEFISSLIIAEKEAKKGYIVTLGIKPTKPETGYGYIQLNELKINQPTKALLFTEKPNLETAVRYINDGNYVWNSGMFIFTYQTMINEFVKYLPNHIHVINEMMQIIKNHAGLILSNLVKSYFNKFERISIDFAIMEKSKIIQCIPVDFGWNDIGGFNSLEDVFERDNSDNVVKNTKYISLDSFNNIILSDRDSRLITSIGVSNMIIVDTEDALLVCRKTDSQRIKELLKLL
ncbi:MAG: sugar phosphate nucleotidyltransferase, partial [Acholeplasma sp.]|nr:sugar phosphate nucleotidyltransferase [Acholeplasma sp.]